MVCFKKHPINKISVIMDTREFEFDQVLWSDKSATRFGLFRRKSDGTPGIPDFDSTQNVVENIVDKKWDLL